MKIGIIGAMEPEVQALIHMLEDVRENSVAKRTFYEGRFHGQDLVVAQCGIGKVNAAISAQIMIDLFQIDLLINTGIAGGLAPELHVGDVVLSTDAVQYDVDVTAFGHPVGKIPEMDVLYFPTLKLNDDILDGLTVPNGNLFTGRIISADLFLADQKKKDALYGHWKAKCVEMEGAAIAHVAYQNDIPCLILRSISDNANGDAGMDYDSFLNLAVENSLAILMQLLPALNND